MSRAWNWRDTSLERVAIRKSPLLNGELTEDTEKVEDASHRREICIIVIPEWQWWRRTAILITQCLGLRWRGGCVTLQGICDSKWWTNDIWSGYRMWACWKQKLRVLGKTNGKVNNKRQEKTQVQTYWVWWLRQVKLDWAEIKQLAHDPQSLSKEQVHTAT